MSHVYKTDIQVIDAYVHQLIVQFGFKPLDTSFRSFVVQGVDEKDCTLLKVIKSDTQYLDIYA